MLLSLLTKPARVQLRGRAKPCQGWGRGFESLHPLQFSDQKVRGSGFKWLFPNDCCSGTGAFVSMVRVRSPLYFYNRNGTHYFSRAVPADLRHRFPKRKIEISPWSTLPSPSGEASASRMSRPLATFAQRSSSLPLVYLP